MCLKRTTSWQPQRTAQSGQPQELPAACWVLEERRATERSTAPDRLQNALVQQSAGGAQIARSTGVPSLCVSPGTGRERTEGCGSAKQPHHVLVHNKRPEQQKKVKNVWYNRFLLLWVVTNRF